MKRLHLFYALVLFSILISCENLFDEKNESYVGHFYLWLSKDNSIQKIEKDSIIIGDSVSTGVQMMFFTDRIIDYCKFNNNEPTMEWFNDNFIWLNPEILIGGENLFEWSLNGIVFKETFKYEDSLFVLTYPASGTKIRSDKSISLKWQPSKNSNSKIKIVLSLKNDLNSHENFFPEVYEVDDKKGTYQISLTKLSEHLKPGKILEAKVERYFYKEIKKEGDLYLIKFSTFHIVNYPVIE